MLKPSELYQLELLNLNDMVKAFSRKEEDEFDNKMQMIAWQTAMLMNSTGNYKKRIKPEDLYTPISELKAEQEEVQEEEDNPEKKRHLQEELLSAFSDSDIK